MAWALSVAALTASCGSHVDRGAGNDDVGTVAQKLTVAEDAIQKRALELGTAVVGAESSGFQNAGTWGEFKRFENGVIVYSDPAGAVFLSNLVFGKWFSLKGTSYMSNDAFVYLGYPLRDYVHLGDHDEAVFEKGTIFATAEASFAVMGPVYERYALARQNLGKPTSDETSLAGTFGLGHVQSFEQGEIVWNTTSTAAYALWGPIRDGWHQLGDVGTLGFPTADPVEIRGASGASLGWSGEFNKGAIYFSPASGPHYLKDSLREAYITRFGGPLGWLGFPISDDLATLVSGDHFNNFQNGVLVDHLAQDSWHGIVPFQSLVFHLNRIESKSTEGACGDVDLYSYVDIANVPSPVHHVRYPSDGDVGSSGDPNQSWTVAPIANNAISVHASVLIKDADTIACPGEEELSFTSDDYNIDNLWGLNSPHVHSDCVPNNGCADADFNMTTTTPYDHTDFRGQEWWSFQNFFTPELSPDQFARTFTDVDFNEDAIRHPFNDWFFDNVYKTIAQPGNCLGMVLLSEYAARGWAPYGEPIHQYYPNTQGGPVLDEVVPMTDGIQTLINEINLKQGFSLGTNDIFYMIEANLLGITHNPNVQFDKLASLGATNASLYMTDEYLFGSAHEVQPIKWEKDVKAARCGDDRDGCTLVQVADPNYPTGIRADDTVLEINPSQNTFNYDVYRGGEWSGGRLVTKPFGLYSGRQTTPFDGIATLLRDGLLVFAGQSGRVAQVTDQAQRTLFEPGISGPPTRWDQIRHTDDARIPNLTPLLAPGGGGATATQMYGGTGGGSTLTFDMVKNPAVAGNAPYDMLFNSGRLSSIIRLTSSDQPDRITARNIGIDGAAVSLQVPANGALKAVDWTLAGLNKKRWVKLSSLLMQPGQGITLQANNAGLTLAIDNSGPPTTANFTVQGGSTGQPDVELGGRTIPSGSSTVNLGQPLVSIALSDQVVGNDGWLIAPVTVTLSAKATMGTGIRSIEYSTDGQNWTTYSGPFAYAQQGVTTLYYRATDDAMNVSQQGSTTFRIDSYKAMILNDGAVGYWRLDEQSGLDVHDSTPAGNTGHFYGTYPDSPTPALNMPGALAGNSAALFYASNSSTHTPLLQNMWTEIPDHANQRPADQKISVEFWFNVTPGAGSPQSFSTLLAKTNTAYQDGYGFYAWGGQIWFYVSTLNNRIGVPHHWSSRLHHIVGTYDGANMRLYYDGALVGTRAWAGGLNVTNAPLRLGEIPGGYITYSGELDEVALYDGVLPANKVLAHYQAASQTTSTPSIGIKNYVLYAGSSIRTGSTVGTGGGAVGIALPSGTGPQLVFGPSNRIDPTRPVFAPSVSLGLRTSIGDTYATSVANGGGFTGEPNGYPAGMPRLPSAPVATPNTTDVTVAKGQSASLPPGSHGALTVFGTVTLLPGTHSFSRILTGSSAVILAGPGSVEVRVAGPITINGGTAVSTSNEPAGNFTIYTTAADGADGSPAVLLGKASAVRAVIVAPNGTMTLQNSVRVTGALAASTIATGDSCAIGYESGLPL